MRGILLDEAIWSCIWCCLWTTVIGSLLVRPQTQTVPQGIRVVMKCSTNLSHGVDWHFLSVNGKEEEIYSSGVLSPIYGTEYKIDAGNPPEGVYKYNLVIESAAERHAGIYICIDDEGLSSDTASAKLKIEDDILQIDYLVEKAPDGNYDSKYTETDDIGHKTVVLVAHSTTISETPVTAKTSSTLIVGLTVGFTIGVAILIITVIYYCLKGRGIGRRNTADADSKQSQRFLPTSTDDVINNTHLV